MNEQFNSLLINDRFYFSKWIYFLLAGLIIGLFSFAELRNEPAGILAFVISGLLISLGFLSKNDNTRVRVMGGSLTIEKRLFGRTRIEKYEIKMLEKIEYKRMVKSDFYTSHGNVKIMGVDATPESLKKYYYHKEIVSFEFQGRTVELGKWKKGFEGKKLFLLLNEKAI